MLARDYRNHPVEVRLEDVEAATGFFRAVRQLANDRAIGRRSPSVVAPGGRELERFIVEEEVRRGYQHVTTPDIGLLHLYETSGHYPYYKETTYAPIGIDDEQFMLRPMTCPHHFALYNREGVAEKTHRSSIDDVLIEVPVE